MAEPDAPPPNGPLRAGPPGPEPTPALQAEVLPTGDLPPGRTPLPAAAPFAGPAGPDAEGLFGRSYRVPKAFSTGALLGFLLLCAATFSVLKFLDQPPATYVLLVSTAVIVALCQMQQWAEPRASSSVAGAVLLPAALVAYLIDHWDEPWKVDMMLLAGSFPLWPLGGAVYGYVVGVVLASVFMFGDWFDTLVIQRIAPTPKGLAGPISGPHSASA